MDKKATVSRLQSRSVMVGYYGAYKARNMIHSAIAIYRILEHRGEKLPKGFGALVRRAKKYPPCSYPERAISLLRVFGIASYRDYLDSELWAAVRRKALDRDSGLCRFCSGLATQVHHSSYDIATLSGARCDELHSTCRPCHQLLEFNDSGQKRPFNEVRAKTLEILANDPAQTPRQG